MEFRMKVHKCKCTDCDVIFLVEAPNNCPDLLVCPNCGYNHDVGYMGVITIVQEGEE